MDIVDAATRSRIMSAIRSRDTGPEREAARILRRAGARGWRRYRRVEGISIDFSWPRLRMALRVQGCFWHRHTAHFRAPKGPRWRFWRNKIERNVRRDERQRRRLRRAGWLVLSVWECEVREASARMGRVVEYVRTANERNPR